MRVEMVFSSLSPASQALRLSHAGPRSSRALTVLPLHEDVTDRSESAVIQYLMETKGLVRQLGLEKHVPNFLPTSQAKQSQRTPSGLSTPDFGLVAKKPP